MPGLAFYVASSREENGPQAISWRYPMTGYPLHPSSTAGHPRSLSGRVLHTAFRNGLPACPCNGAVMTENYRNRSGSFEKGRCWQFSFCHFPNVDVAAFVKSESDVFHAF